MSVNSLRVRWMSQHSRSDACAEYLCAGLFEGSGPSPSVLILVYTAFPCADASALSDSSQGIGVSLGSPFPPSHSPWHPLGSLPCSPWGTQTRWWRECVPHGPLRALRPPSPSMGYAGSSMLPSRERSGYSLSGLTFETISGLTGWHLRQGMPG
jgi:hypothetical protein